MILAVVTGEKKAPYREREPAKKKPTKQHIFIYACVKKKREGEGKGRLRQFPGGKKITGKREKEKSCGWDLLTLDKGGEKGGEGGKKGRAGGESFSPHCLAEVGEESGKPSCKGSRPREGREGRVCGLRIFPPEKGENSVGLAGLVDEEGGGGGEEWNRTWKFGGERICGVRATAATCSRRKKGEGKGGFFHI